MSECERIKEKQNWSSKINIKNIKKSFSKSHSRSNDSILPEKKNSYSVSNSPSKFSSKSKSNYNKKISPALNFMFFIEKKYLHFFQEDNEQILRNVISTTK